MGPISPHTPVKFSGMYKFVPPAGKEESFPEMLSAPPVKDYLSKEMYERDREKGELKTGDPLRSVFFRVRNLVIGFTGSDALEISKKVHEKIGNPIGATMAEVQSKLAKQQDKAFYKTVAGIAPKHFEEAFDEYIQSKGKSLDEIDEFKLT